MSATDTLPRPAETGTDEPDWTHVSCCADPPVALCGVDLTCGYETTDAPAEPGALCPLCEALLVFACPRCGR